MREVDNFYSMRFKLKPCKTMKSKLVGNIFVLEYQNSNRSSRNCD